MRVASVINVVDRASSGECPELSNVSNNRGESEVFSRVQCRKLVVIAWLVSLSYCFVTPTAVFATLPNRAEVAQQLQNGEVRKLFQQKKYWQAIRKAHDLGSGSDKNRIYDFVEQHLAQVKESYADSASARLGSHEVHDLGEIKVFYKNIDSAFGGRAEALNYDFSREFNLDLVPPTVEDGQGVYQLAVEDGVHPGYDDNLAAIDIDSGEFKVFDYLTAQRDRNRGGLFISEDGSVALIDSERSFLKMLPMQALNNNIENLGKTDMQYFFESRGSWEEFASKTDEYWSAWVNDGLEALLTKDEIKEISGRFVARAHALKTKAESVINEDPAFFDSGKKPLRLRNRIRYKRLKSLSTDDDAYSCKGCGCTIL